MNEKLKGCFLHEKDDWKTPRLRQININDICHFGYNTEGKIVKIEPKKIIKEIKKE